MAPLKQWNRGVGCMGVKGEWGCNVAPPWNTYQEDGCAPTMVSSEVWYPAGDGGCRGGGLWVI